MEKMEQSDEDVRYGRMKAVLSEMIESMHHQEDRNVFNVDSREDLDGMIEEEDLNCPPQSPRSGDEVTLIEIQSRGRRPTHGRGNWVYASLQRFVHTVHMYICLCLHFGSNMLLRWTLYGMFLC